MSVLAVVAARNEAGYIETAIRVLIEEGVELVLIDHASIDGTRDLAASYLGAGLLRIIDLPWNGAFDLTEQLIAKQTVYAESRHDWLIHADADEWLRAKEDMSLRDFLRGIEPRYSVVNFMEFAFLPPFGVDLWRQDYRKAATHYYYFAPRPKRLMRAWRRGSVDDTVVGAGHAFLRLPLDQIYPQDQTLRHYLGLSWSHAITRRANRVYSDRDLAQGWHANRLDMRGVAEFRNGVLKVADPWDSRILDESSPSAYHFWELGFAEGLQGARTPRE